MISAVQRIAQGGMRTFALVWSGQVISFIGSGLSSFTLGVWVYQTTGSITQFALISMFFTLPGVVFGPVAGALVDRWDRQRTLIISDTGSGLSTLAIILLIWAGRLETWQIYLAVFVSGTFSALHWSALTAATTQMVPPKHFGRASGLLQIMQAGQVLISPLIAGALIGAIGLQGVLLIDFITFLVAIFTLSVVHIPPPRVTAEGLAGKGSLLREAIFGWTYISARAGLFALMISFSIVNFLLEMINVLVTPLVLSFNSSATLGVVLSISGVGYLAGGVVMSVWGGTKRCINTVIGATLLLGLFAALIGLQPSVPFITLSTFLCLSCLPIVSGSYQVIWQNKVAPDVQGRVFAIRRAILLATAPIAYLVAGPLADKVFEPLLAVKGPLAGSIGQVIGVGQGRGVGLLIISMGLLVIGVTVVSYLYPRLRLVEDELPDVAAEEPTTPALSSSAATVATD